jgi:hypothetical protein
MNEQFFEIIKWITPVILFFLGFIINGLFKKYNNCRGRKRKRKFILYTVKSLIQKNKVQSDQIKACIENLKEIDNTEIIIARVTGNELRNLKEISSIDFYELFYSKRKGSDEQKLKELTNFQDRIDFLEDFYDSFYKSNHETFNRIISHYELFNQSYRELIKQVNQFVAHNIQHNYQKGQDLLIEEVSRIIKEIPSKYGKIIDHISDLYNGVFMPVKDHCKSNKDNPKSTVLLNILQDGEAAYLTIDYNRKNEVKILENKLCQLNEVDNDLKDLIKKLEDSKYRF